MKAGRMPIWGVVSLSNGWHDAERESPAGFGSSFSSRRARNLFFVHGFAKNKQANLSKLKLTAYRKLANLMLRFSGSEIEAARRDGDLIEVECNGEDEAARNQE